MKLLQPVPIISDLALRGVGSTLRPVSPALRAGSGAGGPKDQVFVVRIKTGQFDPAP